MNFKRVTVSSLIAVGYAVVAALAVRWTVVYWGNPWAAWGGGAACLVLVSLAWIAMDRAWLTMRWRGYARPMLDAPLLGSRVRTMTAAVVSVLWEGEQEAGSHPVERPGPAWRVPFDDGSWEEVERGEFYYWLLDVWKRQDNGKNGLAQRYWEPRIGRRQLDARRALLLRAEALANYGPRRIARLRRPAWPTYEAVERAMGDIGISEVRRSE